MANEESNRSGTASRLSAVGNDDSAETTQFSPDRDDRTCQMPADRKAAAARKKEGPAASGDGGELLETGFLLGKRFQIVRNVHSGGMSHIYKAVDRRISSYTQTAFVAIKVLRRQLAKQADTRDSLRREMARVRHLTHPNIISVYDFYEDDDRLFLVMEWLDGESVQDLLLRTRGKRLDEKFAWRVIDDTAKALRYAHDHNVVHADINPANIFITDTQVIKLLDFGLARLHVDDQLTVPKDTVWATRRYASPEVLAGKPATFSDDVFSLGCVAYRLLSGKHAFGGLSAGEAKRKGATPQPIADLDKEKWQHLARALSFESDDRPDSVDGFRTAASELAAAPATAPRPAPQPMAESAPPPPAPPSGNRGRSEGRKKRYGYRWAAAATVLLLALLVPYMTGLPPEAPAVSEPPAPGGADSAPRAATPPAPAAGVAGGAGEQAANETRSDDASSNDAATYEARPADDPPPAETTGVDELLARADEAIAAERLVGPGADSARALLREALELDPDNPAALAALRSVSDRYLDEARSALDAGRPGQAFEALDTAAATDPDNPRLADLEEQLESAGQRALADAESAVATGNLPEADRLLQRAAQFRNVDRQRVDELQSRAQSEQSLYSGLARMNEFLAAGRLVAPPGGNALDVALRLMPGFGDHPRYVGAVNRLGDRLVTEAVAATRAGRFPAAEAYLSALDDLGIMATERNAVRTLIAERRRDARTATATGDGGAAGSIGASARAPEFAGRQPAITRALTQPAVAQAAASDEPAAAEFTPFSELRIERYVAPVFPRLAQFTEKSGFVELKFRILPDGTTRDIEVLAAEPGDLFVSSAEEAVSAWEFKQRDRAVNSRVKLSFEYDQARSNTY